jgi:hypothetical protein
MSEAESSALNDLKGMRTRERNNVTRFCWAINVFTQEASAEDCEYYGYHLYNTPIRLESLDDAIQDFRSDAEYYEDVETCEEYIDTAKRAILRASGELENRFVASEASTAFRM